jgi:hypothetical protein
MARLWWREMQEMTGLAERVVGNGVVRTEKASGGSGGYVQEASG